MMDIRPPGIDGYEAAHRILAKSPRGRHPVLIALAGALRRGL